MNLVSRPGHFDIDSARMLTRLRKKSFALVDDKLTTQLDALYAIAESWGYILLLPIFAIFECSEDFFRSLLRMAAQAATEPPCVSMRIDASIFR
jgi:hypothetical protein